MTQAYWFAHKELGGVPVQLAPVGDCDLSCCASAANGAGWCVGMVATWPKVPRSLPTMHGSKAKPWRMS